MTLLLVLAFLFSGSTTGPADAPVLERRPMHFDAGPLDSAVRPDAMRLTPADRFESARGYGWVVPPERAFVRAELSRSRDAFTIDGVAGTAMTFRADVPDGRWWITLLVESGLEDSSTLSISLNDDAFQPEWQRFDPPAEGRTALQKILRLLHRPVEVDAGVLQLGLTGGADSVRVIGFSLFPDPEPATPADRQLLSRLSEAGHYGSNASLEVLIGDLLTRVSTDPTDAFAAYWLDQIRWLRLAEVYREKMGWEWAKKETGLGIFDRYHGAVMILDGLLDKPGAESWPLFERALFERGRLLHWLALERGGEHERLGAQTDLARLAELHPADPLLAMYLGKQVQVPDACDALRPTPGAPQWSAMQLEALCRMRSEVYWWVQERQIDNGEFGGKLGDDVELLRPWHPLLAIGDTVALRGLRTLADGVWLSDEITDGYATDVSDVEHASEFVSDTAPALALFSNDRVYVERLRPSARHFENLWTGITPQGRRYFKSAWFSSSEIETEPPRNRDVNYNARAAKAVRFLAHQTGDPHVIDLLHEWSSAWVHAASRTDKGKPAGILPASIRFPDEAINGDEPTWYEPHMFWSYFGWAHDAGTSILDQLFHTYLLTDDEALLDPMFSALDLVREHEHAGDATQLEAGSAAWAAATLRDQQDFWTIVEAWRLRTDDDRYDDLIVRYGTPYVRFRLMDKEKHLVAGLEPLLETLRHNRPLRTTEVLHTDRVYMPGNEHLQAMMVGGGTESSPYLAISWTDVDSLFTALVTDSGQDHVEVELFSHADAPRTVGMLVHDLDAGRYRMTTTTGEGRIAEKRLAIQSRADRIDVDVPPQMLLTLRLEAESNGAGTPREVAKLVADRIVEDTGFVIEPALERAVQEDVYAFDFRDDLGPGKGGLFYARSVIAVDSSAATDIELGISHSAGSIEISVDGEVLHRGSDGDEAAVHVLDYDLPRMERTVSIQLPVGSHDLLVKFEAAGSDAEVVLAFVDPVTGMSVPGWRLHAPYFDDNSHMAYLVIGPFEGTIDAVHPPDRRGLQMGVDYPGSDGRRVRWEAPRIHLVTDLADPLDFSDWRYFTGTFLDALEVVGRTFEGLDFTDYVNRHLDFFLDHRDPIARERAVYGLHGSAFGHYFRFELLDDMGMQSVPYANRILRGQGTAADAEIVERVVDHIMTGAARLPDGTFARLNPDSLTVWADDLFMGSIILLRAAEILDRPELLDEAARQALLIHDKLVDPESGAYWHGWFSRTQSPSSSKWGRANGWTMMAKTEILHALPLDHDLYDDVLAIFRSHAEALVDLQADDGRWHQVLDNPDTYLETSATAMFVRAFADGVRMGWLPEEPFRGAAERGWTAVVERVRDDGRVEGIVRGTPIMFSDQQYHEHPTRLNDPRGLGAVLFAAVAMENLHHTSR